MDQDVVALLDLPSDIWTHILEKLVVHDAVMLQSTNKRLFKLCSERFDSVSPNDESMLYFAEIGAISCLQYIHDIGIEWDEDTIATAALKGQLETINFLHQNGCDKDTSACEKAAANGHLGCLKYMHENGFPWDENATEVAARAKNLEMLKYLHENGCPWSSRTCSESARYSFDCLKYTLENIETDQMDEYLRRCLCSSAAMGDNLPALKHLHEAGFPMNRSCDEAALVGSLECLKYAHEHGGRWGYTVVNAAQRGHIECLEYALQNGDNTLVNEPALGYINKAVESGNIECVKILLEHGAQWKGREYDAAAMFKRLEMVKYLLEVAHRPKPTANKACMWAVGDLSLLNYLHENGFSWDGNEEPWDGDEEEEVEPSRTIVYQAIEYDSLLCLKYILECGYELDTNDMSLCNAAARKNNVEILKYLISRGCKIHPSIMVSAARSGALETIRYLHKNGTDLYEDVAISAAKFGQANVLEYALKHGYGSSSMVCEQAAANGYVNCLKLARRYGVSFTTNTMRTASETIHNRFKCLKYLHEHGCEWTHQECTLVVTHQTYQDLITLKYLHEHGSQWNEETWYTAVKSDAVECLEYLFANGCPQDPRTFDMTDNEKCFAFMQQNNIIPNTKRDQK